MITEAMASTSTAPAAVSFATLMSGQRLDGRVEQLRAKHRRDAPDDETPSHHIHAQHRAGDKREHGKEQVDLHMQLARKRRADALERDPEAVSLRLPFAVMRHQRIPVRP